MEDDYLERARELWKQYQFYVYIGLAMILATIAGFTTHHSAYTDTQRVVNQQLYELISSADEQNEEAALAAYQQLQSDESFDELSYLGAFVLASLHFDKADYQQAADILRPALENSNDSGIRHLAALRIAEALISTNDYEQAVDLLSENLPSGSRLRILFEERIGDAEYAAGNIAAARAAYERAIELAEDSASFYQPVLNIKRGALLSTPEAAAQALDEDSSEDDGEGSGEVSESSAEGGSEDGSEDSAEGSGEVSESSAEGSGEDGSGSSAEGSGEDGSGSSAEGSGEDNDITPENTDSAADSSATEATDHEQTGETTQ